MMVEYNSLELIDFYSSNELEISKEHSYLGNELYSIALIENEKIIGAVTLSKYHNKTFLEAIAIDKEYRNKGYANKLIKEITKNLYEDLYTISKNHDFYLKRGYKIIEEEKNMISINCQQCPEYLKTCHPKIMKKKLTEIKEGLDEEALKLAHKSFNEYNGSNWTIEQFTQSLKNQPFLNTLTFYKDNEIVGIIDYSFENYWNKEIIDVTYAKDKYINEYMVKYVEDLKR